MRLEVNLAVLTMQSISLGLIFYFFNFFTDIFVSLIPFEGFISNIIFGFFIMVIVLIMTQVLIMVGRRFGVFN